MLHYSGDVTEKHAADWGAIFWRLRPLSLKPVNTEADDFLAKVSAMVALRVIIHPSASVWCIKNYVAVGSDDCSGGTSA